MYINSLFKQCLNDILKKLNLTKLIYKLSKNLNFDNYFLTFHCIYLKYKSSSRKFVIFGTIWRKSKYKRYTIIQVNNFHFDWNKKLIIILFEQIS